MERLPSNDSAFITANYLAARNGLRVAGHDFGLLAGSTSQTMDILFPGPYALAGRIDADSAQIDGRPYTAPRWLGAGRHVLTIARPSRYTLVWQPATALLAAPVETH
jgi:hypothetical protein